MKGPSSSITAFTQPSFFNTLSSQSPSSTKLTCTKPDTNFLQRVPSPPRPPSFSNNNFRRRTAVVAWLIGHYDHVVLSTAASTSSTACIIPLRGVPTACEAIRQARFRNATHFYYHINAVSPSDFNILLKRKQNIILVPVTSAISVPHVRSTPVFSVAGVTMTAPLLVERKGDTVVQFFETDDNQKKKNKSNTNQLLLRRETQSDDRPWMIRLSSWLTRVYLPQGYPLTTTPDYISFTKYRTIQNFASSIMKVISTEALLFGLGLGQKVAAGAAATSWVLKDGLSYLVKIGYGSKFGSKFDDDPKSWRIAADIVEDVGGAIEILTPLFGRKYFLPLASLAVCLNGMASMTGTATRHVIYRSLATKGTQNTGDIATKGESQGVTCKMVGLAAGIIISSKIGQKYYALLTAYSILASIHIVANWKSVQCVQLSFFNKQRASILIDSHLRGDASLPCPYEASKREKIILPPWHGFDRSVNIGASVNQINNLTSAKLTNAKRTFKGERFLIVKENKKYSILLREDSSSMDALRAYYVVKYIKSSHNNDNNIDVGSALKYMKKHIGSFQRQAEQSGWDTRHMLLPDGQSRVNW